MVELLAGLLAHAGHGLAAAIGALGLVHKLLARQMLWQRQAFENIYKCLNFDQIEEYAEVAKGVTA